MINYYLSSSDNKAGEWLDIEPVRVGLGSILDSVGQSKSRTEVSLELIGREKKSICHVRISKFEEWYKKIDR